MDFRLINYSSNDAATNMAIDEAILEAHLSSAVPPTLRFYTFSPPAVSIGYAQKIDDETIKRSKKAGITIVRRPTGGRAVLHLGDLTYAFICSSRGCPTAAYALVDESITKAYKQICQAFISAFASINLDISFGGNDRNSNNYKDKQDCFLATTTADLQFKEKKLIGSAQLRRRHAVLQHGSLILKQPQSLLHHILNDKTEKKNEQDRHINLFEILEHQYSMDDLQQLIIRGFTSTFNRQFVAQGLTTQEQNLVDKLIPKYKTIDHWD